MKKFAVITSARPAIICFEDIIEDSGLIVSLSDLIILERKTDEGEYPKCINVGTVLKEKIIFFEDLDSAKLYYDLNFAN